MRLCFILSLPDLEIASLDPYGTGTVWPVWSSPSRSLSALRDVEDTLMTLVLFGERQYIQINVKTLDLFVTLEPLLVLILVLSS